METSEPIFSFGPFRLKPQQRVLERAGSPVVVGSRAFDLLAVLVRDAGRVIANRELLAAAWPGAVVEENNLRVQLGSLRKLLGDWQEGKPYIANVPLRGYSFVAPVQVEAQSPEKLPAAGKRHNLPTRLNQMIGRDATVSQLTAMLPSRRLVTLVGPGGIGKTTVAVAVATNLLPSCEDGVRFVDLSSLTGGAPVAGAVAATLGISVLSDDPRLDVMTWISGRRILVVLDNCEHVIDDAAALAEMLIQADGVMVLVTSREPLRVANEWLHRLPPLAVPPIDDAMSIDALLEFPAAQLFVERASYSAGQMVFTDSDAPLLAQICRHLDGLPLAIELVAARIDMFGLAGLAAQLDDRLQFLGQGRRTALPRHQTLRHALDWSFDLLSPAERQVLGCLSVFRERFGTADALVVSEGQGTPAVIANLVSKSLLSADPANRELPYRLLETTRSYAGERLAASGEQDAVARRHALWCRNELDGAEAHLKVLGPAAWRARYARKLDDVRVALAWLWQAGGTAIARQLVVAAIPMWFNLGLLKECMAQLKLALRSTADCVHAPAVEARLLVASAHCSIVLGGPTPEADAALARARLLTAGIQDTALILVVSWTLFIRHVIHADYAAAQEEAAHFGEAAEAASDRDAIFVHHRMRALALHFLGDQPRARWHVDEALRPEAISSVGLLHGTPQQSDHRTASQTHLARILWLQGEVAQAMEAIEQAHLYAQDTGHALPVAYALAYACCPVALWAGDLQLARRYIAMLQECTSRHSLAFWEGWPRMYAGALEVLSGSALPTSISLAGLNQGHFDMLATLNVGFLPSNGMARVDLGASAWCAPEILRTCAGVASRRADAAPAKPEALLRRAVALAEDQGAWSWALRSQTDLTRLLAVSQRGTEAREHLDMIRDRIDTASTSMRLHQVAQTRQPGQDVPHGR